MGSDPVTGDELEEQGAIETAAAAIVDVLGRRLVAQLGEPQPGGELAIMAEAPFAVEQQREPFGMGKPRLLGISKRGNAYLRTLLIHGARAALPSLSKSDVPLGRWLKAMIERGVHRNAVVVALANKLARIAWAALRKGASFERSYLVAV